MRVSVSWTRPVLAAALIVTAAAACESSQPFASTSTVGQSSVLETGYVDTCGGRSQQVGEDVQLPAWAAAARSMAGPWLISDESNAVAKLAESVEGQNRFSVLWLFNSPQRQASDFEITAIRPSGGVVDATDVTSSAPGFVVSEFTGIDGGCWTITASWGSEEATLRTFVSR